MAFHEQHERNCPHSKCLSCGRRVDDDDEPTGGRSKFFLAKGIVGLLVVAGVIFFIVA